MLTKNAVQKLSKMFGVKKKSKSLSLLITFMKCSLHSRCSLSLMYREKRKLQYCSLNCDPSKPLGFQNV